MEEFGIDGVIVTLEWAQENLYNITTTQYLPFTFSASTSVQIEVPYNALYNVSALSIDPCGQNSFFGVYYGELSKLHFIRIIH